MKLADAKIKARQIRVLWFMRELGGGWLGPTDLANNGAFVWSIAKYIFPSMLNDGLIDRMQTGPNRFVYKPTAEGLALLDEAEKYVQEEYDKAVLKCRKFREKYNIHEMKAPTVGYTNPKTHSTTDMSRISDFREVPDWI